MRVLVTGGAGFIGSHLVEILLSENHEVVVIDDLSTGNRRNLADATWAEFIEGSILDKSCIDPVLKRVDLVYHLAATVGVQHVLDSPLEAMLVNARGTDHLLARCATLDLPVVVASTSEVNGKPTKLPMHEDDDRVLGSTAITRWSYASAKALDEHLCLAYSARGLPAGVVRYFNAYGPRLDPRGYGSVIARFIAQALEGAPLTVHGDGCQTRSFAYVEDTARATYLAGVTTEAQGAVINIGSVREIAMLELARIVRDVVVSPSAIELVPHRRAYGPGFEDTRRRVPDITRAEELLGWQPTIDLEEGLARTVEWWLRTNGDRGSRKGHALPEPSTSRTEPESPRVGVMGLGYVGLPLAIAYADAGFRTVGFDTDSERVAALNSGFSPIEDIDDDVVRSAVAEGRFEATTLPSAIGACDCVFVCVPTPFDAFRTPDLSCVRAAAKTLAKVLRPGMLIVLQSTTFPGTTTEVVQPILERSGLRAGVDFDLAFAPERVDPGNSHWTVRNTPKVVAAVTPAGSARAVAILEAMMEAPGHVRALSTPATAEMTKLLENTYRAVNIALVNELAMLTHEMGIDIWEVVDGAATKPFGFASFRPGVGPGGHCIPVDPHYLSWKARSFDFQTKFIELAADINLRMVDYVRHRIASLLNRSGQSLRDTNVLAIGVAFKAGVSDLRNSRALRLLEILEQDGAVVTYSDPYVPVATINNRECKSVELTEDVVGRADLALLLVDHPGLDIQCVLDAGIPVFDAVNVTGRPGSRGLERL